MWHTPGAAGSHAQRVYVLGAAGLPHLAAGPAAWQLATQHVSLLGSAVTLSSVSTYHSNRHRFVRFCEEELGLSEAEVFLVEHSVDLNLMLVCLFITWAAARYVKGSVEGKLSAHAVPMKPAGWSSAFGGFCGVHSELFALTPADLSQVPVGGVSVWLARSKGDQLGKGTAVFLGERTSSGIPVRG